MLIRCRGYNNGVQEYLEEGVKSGRELSREELDERIILDGDLDLTRMVYQSIPDNGQERYATFTLSFFENEMSDEVLHEITTEFKQHLMCAYQDDEYNFYAEAHIPKIKEIINKKTGEMEVRKPHIHIVVPRKNLLTGREMNPRGMYDTHMKSMEAFQEYINQKYQLESPRDHIRFNPQDAASVLSRYKGDDFYGKNREFKQALVKEIIDKNITNRGDFYELVSNYGETKIRNNGKPNEYIAVKLSGDAKFTNLKDTIFNDDFIVNRQLKRAPLDKKVITERLDEWKQAAKEIKYVSKATPSFRKKYKEASAEEKINLLNDREQKFYQKNGRHYDDLLTPGRERNNQRSFAEAQAGNFSGTASSLQIVHGGDVANDGNAGQSNRQVLLPSDARIHMGQSQQGGNNGLRSALSTNGGRRGRRGRDSFEYNNPFAPSFRGKQPGRTRFGQRDPNLVPPYAHNLHRVATIGDIETHSRRLFASVNSSPLTADRAIQLPKIKQFEVKRNASTVAAYFLRQFEQNQLLPGQRRAIRSIDQKFFASRRAVMSDDRFSRLEKMQLMSVLNFERLKAREVINHPENREDIYMGSAEIRGMMKTHQAERIPNNSISAGDDGENEKAPSARKRINRLITNINQYMEEKRKGEQKRKLTAGDLYTRRSRIGQNVHYIDKKTDQTMFIDTGKSIAMRRNGINEPAVAVALQLAKERFGSTLTIKGNDEFKTQVIEAVVKNSLNIHFTDKDMNQRLADRRAELEIERDGQKVEQPKPEAEERSNATTSYTKKEGEDAEAVAERASDPEYLGQRAEEQFNQQAKDYSTYEVDLDRASDPEYLGQQTEALYNQQHDNSSSNDAQFTVRGKLLEHGSAPYKFDKELIGKQDNSYFVKLETDKGNKTYWGVGLAAAVSERNIGDHIKLSDMGSKSVVVSIKEDDGTIKEVAGYRREWKSEREQPDQDVDYGPTLD
ncbi:TPA: molybdopterin-guanine dinucleotide biosynthesis protein MobB [Yersinia enterocolitica]|nr:molybdopterin-guanine dinucleotide biosynthesis protein MobB [Yersinia enterocolitica]